MKFLAKLFATLLILVTIFILMYLGLVYYLGVKSKESIDHEVAFLTGTGFFKVEDYHYAKGWFSSEAQVKVSIRKNILDTIHAEKFPEILGKVLSQPVLLKTHIQHGPFVKRLFLRGYANTEVVFQKDVEQEVVKFFGTKHPLQIENILRLSGAGVVDFNLEPMDYKELSGIQIKFSGLRGQLNYQKGYEEYAWNMNLPSFYIKFADKGKVFLTGLVYRSNNYPSQDSVDTGFMEVSFDELVANAQLEDQIRLGLSDLLGLASKVRLSKFLNPYLMLGKLDIQLKDFLLHTQVDQNGSLMRMEGNMGLNELRLNDQNYGPFRIKLSAQHLNGRALQLLKSYLSALADENLSFDQWQEKLLAYIRGPAVRLFTDNPSFELNELFFQLPEGEVKVHGTLSFEGLTPQDLSNFDALITHAHANIEYFFPEVFAINLFKNQITSLLSSGKESIGSNDLDSILKTADYLVKSSIAGFSASHYIQLEDGNLKGSIQLKDSRVYFNGLEYKREETDIDDLYSKEDAKRLEQNSSVKEQ
ncbi:MAG: YdgA family protein [Neisseriaceae bacterium]